MPRKNDNADSRQVSLTYEEDHKLTLLAARQGRSKSEALFSIVRGIARDGSSIEPIPRTRQVRIYGQPHVFQAAEARLASENERSLRDAIRHELSKLIV